MITIPVQDIAAILMVTVSTLALLIDFLKFKHELKEGSEDSNAAE